jgi:NADH-quinone oxidoreductase subunit C
MNEIISKLEAIVPGAILESRPFGRSRTGSIWIEMQSIGRVAKALVETKGLEFDWLENLSAMDIDQALVLTYFIRSTTTKDVLIVRGSVVPTGPGEPIDVASVVDHWSMARGFEDEISDLFGIRFGRKRGSVGGLLPAGWDGYPLRKGFAFPTEFMEMMHMRPPGQTLQEGTGDSGE